MSRSLAVAACLFLTPGLGLRAANAAPQAFVATLSGSNESPPNASPAIGSTTVIMDVVAHTMRIIVNFSGLLGLTTASHIHAPTATPFTDNIGVATTLPSFPGFPLGVSAGTYDHTFDTTDTSSFSSAFVAANGGTAAGAEAGLLQAMVEGRSYLNIHNQIFPAGEIRGFLVPLFTDDPLTAGVTLVQAVHVSELRQLIDVQRARVALNAFAWTDPALDPAVTLVKAQHILDLRLAITQAYAAAGLAAPTFGDPGLSAGTTIGRAHIADVRAAVLALSIQPVGRMLTLNEVDYDQIGTDTAEFVEIFNPGAQTTSLDGVAVVFVNGSNNAEYLRINLSGTLGSGGYAVIASAVVTPQPGSLVFPFPLGADNIQNGSPDGIAIVDTNTGTIVDALSYEGQITAATINGIGTVNLVEGTALSATVADSNSIGGALARIPNGQDTDNAATDWSFTTTTPGSANAP